MRVFTDYHHGDLYFSLHTLFEKRLGFELYRPIGWEWFNEGYWKIAEPYNNAKDTIGQYLDINKDGWIPFKNLNGQHYVEDDVYHVYDMSHDYYHRAITLEKFKSMTFDIIMPTYEPHERPFIELKNKYQPQAKMLSQMGNTCQHSILPNVIHSVPYQKRTDQNTYHYYQEIDLEMYRFFPPSINTKNIYSFVSLYPYPRIYNSYKKELYEVNMKYYGAGCPDGLLSGAKIIAEKMRESNIGWHLKQSDGFGHTALGWFASGRPVITNMSQVLSFGGQAPSYFIPGKTCIDLDRGTIQENCKLIRKVLEPEENIKWCENAYKTFNDIVNYEEMATNMRIFMENLRS